MSFLKIGTYLINEDHITHIDLESDMYDDEDNKIKGICIYFISQRDSYNEEVEKTFNTPYCLRLSKEEDIEAVRYYYKRISKTSILDLGELYNSSVSGSVAKSLKKLKNSSNEN